MVLLEQNHFVEDNLMPIQRALAACWLLKSAEDCKTQVEKKKENDRT